MPIPVPDALDDAAALAAAKATQVARLPRYLVSSAFAGAFIGIAVVLLVSVSAPLVADGNPATKLVQGSVFGIALTLVVFAGAELFTGNAMYMVQGIVRRTVTPAQLAAVWVASLVGNLAGSIAFAALVHAGGSLSGPGSSMIAGVVAAKDALTGPQLLSRSILCNALVCLALWMAGRTKSDAAKLVVLWWALMAFIASGFEHSIANMTLFGLGIFDGSATWGQLGRNLVWTVPGNIIGGGLLIGLAYAYLGATHAADDDAVLEPVPAPGHGDDPAARVAEPSAEPADGHLDDVLVG
jgi:nitrite transporter NirC